MNRSYQICDFVAFIRSESAHELNVQHVTTTIQRFDQSNHASFETVKDSRSIGSRKKSNSSHQMTVDHVIEYSTVFYLSDTISSLS